MSELVSPEQQGSKDIMADRPPPDVYRIAAPEGGFITIPATVDDKTDPYLKLKSAEDIRRYYDEEGYVVLRGVLPASLCDSARRAFTSEIKTYSGYIYRQASASPEKNVFTEHGHVLNSILNIQDLNRRVFPSFSAAGMAILTHDSLRRAVRTLLGEDGTLVQSMYFDGNPVTWAHQDTYYLDSTELGRMTAAWIAMEDIEPGAGRFFVYPKSHAIDMVKNGGDFDIAFNHDRYKNLVIDVITRNNLSCHAPALRKGDVLFWAARTIHGSLQTQSSSSRSSFTGHFVPSSTGLLQYQTRPRRMKVRPINGVPIHHPKDQNMPQNQALLYMETRFPTLFGNLKRVAIKVLVR